MIGCNGRGGNHIDAYTARKDCEIAYIVDIDEKVGQKGCDAVEKRSGRRPKWVKDMRQVFDDKSIHFVSVATPNHWHSLAAVWAMQAGKDVYLEKPVSHDLAEGRSLVAAAKKYKRICQAGTQCRSNPAILEAMKFLADDGIGYVGLARGLCYKRRRSIGPLGDYPIPAEVDFDLWSGPAPYTTPKLTRPKFHYDWHWQRLYGNGDTGNQGPHQTDISRWGLGLNRHPNSVIAYGGRLGYQAERKDPKYVDAGNTLNTQIAIYDYGDKCIVFETRGLSVDDSADTEINKLFAKTKGDHIGVIFYGTEGILVQREYTHCVAYDLKGNVIKEFRGGGDQLHFDNFIKAVQSRKAESLSSNAFQGHLSASLAHLANISSYLGESNKVTVEQAKAVLEKIKSRDDNIATLNRTVQHFKDNGVDLAATPMSIGPLLHFDPEKEVFTDSAEANKLIAREYRAPLRLPHGGQGVAPRESKGLVRVAASRSPALRLPLFFSSGVQIQACRVGS